MVVLEKTWITEVWVCISQSLAKSWPGPYTGLGLQVLALSLALYVALYIPLINAGLLSWRPNGEKPFGTIVKHVTF